MPLPCDPLHLGKSKEWRTESLLPWGATWELLDLEQFPGEIPHCSHISCSLLAALSINLKHGLCISSFSMWLIWQLILCRCIYLWLHTQAWVSQKSKNVDEGVKSNPFSQFLIMRPQFYSLLGWKVMQAQQYFVNIQQVRRPCKTSDKTSDKTFP